MTQDHSLPVQVFVNKSGESTERPVSPVLPQATCSTPPVLCSTPKPSESNGLRSRDQEVDEISTCDDTLHVAESLSLQSEESTVTVQATCNSSGEQNNAGWFVIICNTCTV